MWKEIDNSRHVKRAFAETVRRFYPALEQPVWKPFGKTSEDLSWSCIETNQFEVECFSLFDQTNFRQMGVETRSVKKDELENRKGYSVRNPAT